MRLSLAAAALCATAAPAAARWTPEQTLELVALIGASAAEGLDPAAYDADAIERALPAGGDALDLTADRAALALAHDFDEGAAPPAARIGWTVTHAPLDGRAWLDRTLAAGPITAAYQALLPQGPAYRTLKTAYATCTGDACIRLRANLERWRWLPRNLGERYLWVNVPAFRLDLVEQGAIRASHRVIVGKPGSKTPAFAAAVTGVTINPWWTVPRSIVAESVGRLMRSNPALAAQRGYVATRRADGSLAVRQRPGADNALGQVKLEMPNPYSIFIHDTPTKALFDRDTRAFSHGCIRTEDPAGLAKTLLPAEEAERIDLLLLAGTTRTIALPQPIPVYVVYFTAEPDPDATDRIAAYPDVYGRDAAAGGATALAGGAQSGG